MTMDFKPCPICGKELSLKSVYFFDDEGNECDHASDQFVAMVIVSCDCGYSFATHIGYVYEEEEDLYEGGSGRTISSLSQIVVTRGQIE